MIFKINVGFHREGDAEGYMAEVLNELTDNSGVNMKVSDILAWIAYSYDNVPDGYSTNDAVIQFAVENQ